MTEDDDIRRVFLGETEEERQDAANRLFHGEHHHNGRVVTVVCVVSACLCAVALFGMIVW